MQFCSTLFIAFAVKRITLLMSILERTIHFLLNTVYQGFVQLS